LTNQDNNSQRVHSLKVTIATSTTETTKPKSRLCNFSLNSDYWKGQLFFVHFLHKEKYMLFGLRRDHWQTRTEYLLNMFNLFSMWVSENDTMIVNDQYYVIYLLLGISGI
jgi:hypothetical protein